MSDAVTIPRNTARELLELAVDGHNQRPGCDLPDCTVCRRNVAAGLRLIEIGDQIGIAVSAVNNDARHLFVEQP